MSQQCCNAVLRYKSSLRIVWWAAVLTGWFGVLNRSTTSLKLAGVTLLSVTPWPRPLLSSWYKRRSRTTWNSPVKTKLHSYYRCLGKPAFHLSKSIRTHEERQQLFISWDKWHFFITLIRSIFKNGIRIFGKKCWHHKCRALIANLHAL